MYGVVTAVYYIFFPIYWLGLGISYTLLWIGGWIVYILYCIASPFIYIGYLMKEATLLPIHFLAKFEVSTLHLNHTYQLTISGTLVLPPHRRAHRHRPRICLPLHPARLCRRLRSRPQATTKINPSNWPQRSLIPRRKTSEEEPRAREAKSPSSQSPTACISAEDSTSSTRVCR